MPLNVQKIQSFYHKIMHFTATFVKLSNLLLICLTKKKKNPNKICNFQHYTATHKLLSILQRNILLHQVGDSRGRLQYLRLQKEISQIGKKSLRSNTGIAIHLRAKNMLWCLFLSHTNTHTHTHTHTQTETPFLLQSSIYHSCSTLQPCPCYCTLSHCWLNKLLLDVWGPTPAINLFTFN